MYRTRNTQKQNNLMKTDRNIFKTSDLAVLWAITNKNTLWTTAKRYVDNSILFPIQKGLYSKISIENLDPFEIGCAMAGQYSYVSTETVLFNEGVISQKAEKITLVGLKNLEFSFGGYDYICRKLPEVALTNRVGINIDKGFSIASAERALADLLYFQPKYFFDNKQVINRASFRKLSSELLYR